MGKEPKTAPQETLLHPCHLYYRGSRHSGLREKHQCWRGLYRNRCSLFTWRAHYPHVLNCRAGGTYQDLWWNRLESPRGYWRKVHHGKQRTGSRDTVPLAYCPSIATHVASPESITGFFCLCCVFFPLQVTFPYLTEKVPTPLGKNHTRKRCQPRHQAL